MRKKVPNKQYNLAKADGFAAKVITYQRRKMYGEFVEFIESEPNCTLLDVGATSDQSYESSNYLEAWYPTKSAVTAVGIDNAKFLEEKYEGVKFVQANGLNLPFADGSYDVVHSSAVLEHVGSLDNQIRFVQECARVSRKHIFLTTPNRWFPVEFHTALPFIHWLPRPWFRGILRAIGIDQLSKEENLNLLGSRDIHYIKKNIQGYRFKVYSVSLVGWPSNLLIAGTRI
jgi:ubiquinone/menaquinone biosynthesis C-methylase UbiE